MGCWKEFFKTSLTTCLVCLGVFFAFYIVTDPYDRFLTDCAKIPARPFMSERFFMPGLAYKSHYNSAIFGTSTIQLLKPQQLNPLFKEKFVNLAFASATAYEQSKLFDLFLQNHPHPDTIIFAIDVVWCDLLWREKHHPTSPTGFYFPEFLYQGNRLLDLIGGVNLRTVDNSFKQLLVNIGFEAPLNREDGYWSFLPPSEMYSLERARHNIYYGQFPPPPRPLYQEDKTAPLPQFDFPQAHYMEEMLAKLPPETKKIILIVPYHYYGQPSRTAEAPRWRAAKKMYKDMVLRYPNAHFIDFMIDSYITEKDENYWDALHYRVEIADTLAHLIHAAVIENKKDPAFLYERSF